MGGSDLAAFTDEELLTRYRRGELKAMSEIVERYKRPLFTFVLRMCRDRARAEDLVQETFVRLVSQQSAFKSNARLKTWLYTIARNACLDDMRRGKVRRSTSLDGDRESSAALHERLPSAKQPPDAASASAQVGQRILVAIDTLPDDQREVFLLRQVELLSFREIAEVIGVPENTAKSRMRYALERLQVQLSDLSERPEEVSP